MIQVSFKEPDTPAWKDWKKRATEEIDRLKKLDPFKDEIKINNALYKEMKQEIFDAFHGKCAYCETVIAEVDQHGDVEHYRPKGRIMTEDGNPVTVDAPDGTKKPHPGYYWLAYDWTNLLPACALCNQPSKNRQGQTVGKWDRFPVKGDFHALAPGDEVGEKPLFVHPVLQNPEKHFVLNGRRGILGSKTDEGKACIKILDLNRRRLREQRKAAYQAIRAHVLEADAATNLDARKKLNEKIDLLAAHIKGQMPYTLATREAIRDATKSKMPLLQLFLPFMQRNGS